MTAARARHFARTFLGPTEEFFVSGKFISHSSSHLSHPSFTQLLQSHYFLYSVFHSVYIQIFSSIDMSYHHKLIKIFSPYSLICYKCWHSFHHHHLSSFKVIDHMLQWSVCRTLLLLTHVSQVDPGHSSLSALLISTSPSLYYASVLLWRIVLCTLKLEANIARIWSY